MKGTIKDQTKKLKQIDERSKKTQQVIEPLNSSRAEDMLPDGGRTEQGTGLGGSPLLPREKALAQERKKLKPQITDFDILEVVGIGNFGKVHKAFNKRENRVCALKILKKESVAQMKHVDHIINEREVL